MAGGLLDATSSSRSSSMMGAQQQPPSTKAFSVELAVVFVLVGQPGPAGTIYTNIQYRIQNTTL